MRALTLNLWACHGDWPARREVLRRELPALDVDVVLAQEAIVDDGYDQLADVLGDGYEVVHQTVGLVGDRRHHGASLASRWPVRAVHEVDLHVTPRTGDYSCGAVIAEIEAPPPIGGLLAVCHGAYWPRWAERERELQAGAVVRRVDELIGDRAAHVVVGGDFNATPDCSSMRFWTGRSSLEGVSTAYLDAWESVHGDEPGATFDPANPLTAVDEPGLDRGRRVDYLLVRSGGHGATLRVADCRVVLDAPVGGAYASDHYGVLADLVPM